MLFPMICRSLERYALRWCRFFACKAFSILSLACTVASHLVYICSFICISLRPPLLCSDIEEKRTASQPSLCEDSKLCTDDALDDYANSNSVQTEVLMDESLASQSSGVRDVPDPETQESSPLNPASAISHHGLPNSAALFD